MSFALVHRDGSRQKFLGALPWAGMAITLAAIGMASMVAHRLIIAEGRSQEIGRFTAIAASLIVIATGGTLLLGSLERFLR